MSGPVEHFPSEDGGHLAVVLRQVQWTLDDLAHDLPAGRVVPQRLRELAITLRRLAVHLDSTSGTVPGEIGQR